MGTIPVRSTCPLVLYHLTYLVSVVVDGAHTHYRHRTHYLSQTIISIQSTGYLEETL